MSDNLTAQISAGQTLQHIRALKKLPAFEEYFLRRVREKREVLARRVLEGDMSFEEREVTRVAWLTLGEVLTLTDTDEAACDKIIGAQKAG